MDGYISPKHKLLKLFKEGRDNWKKKYTKSKKRIKYFENRVRFLVESKASLKQQVKDLKQKLNEQEILLKDLESKKKSLETKNRMDLDGKNKLEQDFGFDKNITNHTYSTSHIELWLSFVINSAIGLRAASKVMNKIASFFKLNVATPSWYTGRLWLMRLGHYKLHCPKEKATDWIWIIDHAVQMGAEKCLLILGIRQSNLPDRPLKFSDLQPIELLPVTKSNGDIVYEQLKLSVEKTGKPMQIVADHGPDVKSGIEKFCETHNTIFTYDIKHKLASILKHALEKDVLWQNFIKQATNTKRLLQQTELAFLSPPNQRSKARYMNIDRLVHWGLKTLDFLKIADVKEKGKYDIEQLNNKIGWVREYKTQLNQWKDILQITTSAESFVRHRGIYNGAHHDLAQSFSNNNFDSKVDKIKNEVIDFVRSESLKAKPGEKLLGSSEIIESIFGKQKFIEKEQSKSGFTGLLLALPALVSENTAEIINEAMKSTPVKKVINWYKQNIGKSVQSKKLEQLSFSEEELNYAEKELKLDQFTVT